MQDQTTNSAVVDSNNASTALAINSGDTLVYTVKVSNTGAAASNGDDNMVNTLMTDTLPTGVELVRNPSERTITENLGTIAPGQLITKAYL